MLKELLQTYLGPNNLQPVLRILLSLGRLPLTTKFEAVEEQRGLVGFSYWATFVVLFQAQLNHLCLEIEQLLFELNRKFLTDD